VESYRAGITPNIFNLFLCLLSIEKHSPAFEGVSDVFTESLASGLNGSVILFEVFTTNSVRVSNSL